MKKPVLNSAMTAALPESVEAGKAFTIQLAPKGEYPQFVDDPEKPGEQKEVVQILDDASISTLVDNFKDKVLVDADHSSETSTNTRAYAWVTKLFVDPEKGLMAEIEPTTVGAEAINGKEYRFVSGAWTLDDDGRPVELVSIGLTNKPNLPVAPMINAKAAQGKDDAGDAPSNADEDIVTHEENPEANAAEAKNDDAQSVAAPDEPRNPENKNEGKLKMDIREKFGLPAEATDADVETAIDAVLAKCEGMEQVQNALGLDPTTTNEEVVETLNAVISACGEYQKAENEMKEAQLNAEAEKLVSENEDIIPEEQREEIVKQYKEDPEAAKATVANMRRVYDRAVLNAQNAQRAATRVINARAAMVPTVAVNSAGICGKTPEEQNAWIKSHPNG